MYELEKQIPPTWDKEITDVATQFHDEDSKSAPVEVFDDFGDFMKWLDDDITQTA